MNSTLKDFELIKEIGKGSFATVAIVRRKADKKIYAMKRVKIGSMGNKEKENALNEVRLLASINCKQVIGYKEAFFDEETQALNIIMEYADDEDLDKKIKGRAKANYNFKEDEIWFYTIQIVKGLKSLHDKRIMHRDLKSANIFLTKSGGVKIGDLNVSKLIKEKMAHTQTGTPYYASPEVWADVSYDYKSDIWSLGCIVYEMCCLKTPFRAKGLNELFEVVSKGVYSPIPEIYSEKLADLIAKMLVVNPDKRIDCQGILKLDYVVEKIDFFKKNLKHDNLLESHPEGNELMLNTIKVPKNLSEIPNSLPKKTNYYDTAKEFNIEVVEDKFDLVDSKSDNCKDDNKNNNKQVNAKSQSNNNVNNNNARKDSNTNNNNVVNNTKNCQNMLVLDNGEHYKPTIKQNNNSNVIKKLTSPNNQNNQGVKSNVMTISETDNVIIITNHNNNNNNNNAYGSVNSQRNHNKNVNYNNSVDNSSASKLQKISNTSLRDQNDPSPLNQNKINIKVPLNSYISSNIDNNNKGSQLQDYKNKGQNLDYKINKNLKEKVDLNSINVENTESNKGTNEAYNKSNNNNLTEKCLNNGSNILNNVNKKLQSAKYNTRNLSDNKVKNISQSNTNDNIKSNNKKSLIKNTSNKLASDVESGLRSKTPGTADINISIKGSKKEIFISSKTKEVLRTIGEPINLNSNSNSNCNQLRSSINVNVSVNRLGLINNKQETKQNKKLLNNTDTHISNKSKDKNISKDKNKDKSKDRIIQSIKNINNQFNSNMKLVTNNNNYHVNSKVPNSLNTLNTLQTMNNHTVEYDSHTITNNTNNSLNNGNNKISYSNNTNNSHNINNNKPQTSIVYSVKQSNLVNQTSSTNSQRTSNYVKGNYLNGVSKGKNIDSSSTRKISTNIYNEYKNNHTNSNQSNIQSNIQSPLNKQGLGNFNNHNSGKSQDKPEKNNKHLLLYGINSPPQKYYQNSINMNKNPDMSPSTNPYFSTNSNSNVNTNNNNSSIFTPPKSNHYSSNSGSLIVSGINLKDKKMGIIQEIKNQRSSKK